MTLETALIGIKAKSMAVDFDGDVQRNKSMIIWDAVYVSYCGINMKLSK